MSATVNKKYNNQQECYTSDDNESEKENNENNEIMSISSSNSRSSRSTIGSRSRRRRKPKKPILGYKFDASYTENHKTVIYGVVFNHYLPQHCSPVFATVGSNRCSVYECGIESGITLLFCYADPDADEVFYTCIWSCHPKTRQSLLIAAGNRGIIRIFKINQHYEVASLIGHGGAVNQLKVHPILTNLLLSCSKDYAIRLWNMETKALIAIFGGVDGHRAEVLTIDFDLPGERFASGGMDHAIKIWDINNANLKERIQLSTLYNAERAEKQFPTAMQHYPDYSTREVHGNYVDCLQWFGNFIISKSCQDFIIIWRIGERTSNNSNNTKRSQTEIKPEYLAEFKCKNCELWFVRFDFNIWQNFMACGNEIGKIYVWEFSPNGPEDARAYILSRKTCKTTVRQVAFSKDTKILLAVCDDGTIWRWNKL